MSADASHDQIPDQAGDPPNHPAPNSIFSKRQRALIVAIVSVAATFSGFASNIYFPSIPTIAAELSVSNELVDLTVTSYMIFQGLSPTVWGAIADVHGRRITYICTFVIFFGACIGLAETRHYHQLLILRCLQSTGSASTVAIGAGVLSDITTREERGGYMGMFQAGLLIPLAIGPTIGGALSQNVSWKAIFWFLAIYSGAFLIILIYFLPETLPLLVSNRSLRPNSLLATILSSIRDRRLRVNCKMATEVVAASSSNNRSDLDLLSPLRILFGMEVTFAIVFLSIYYTVWQMTITAMSTLFNRTYGLSEMQIGLVFIANGVGCIIGTLTTGKLLDIDYRRNKDRYTGSPEFFPLESARLRTVWLWSGLQCASTLVFGWTVDQEVHIALPIICTFIVGWAATSSQSVVTTFLVDVFPKRSSSASAALNLARCLLGAGGTATVLPIINAITVGWTFTVLTGVMLMALGLVLLQMSYGATRRRLREKREADSESGS
ncbi:major facilitator superfamily domain-containing protein [Lipomyces orientalis]|uniref:Major facilitator superfamily domain-containing protein n=1 Tax=Lipomyces orientalis TaxID=1233043 RepID=A0ACC3TIP2_9ASCO